ncbi:Uncharacterized protein TCM_025194 [Theobroma cacao]|uniref:RNase H type-1 domain-containing protein n=1 Tax=Theobroma cacao TaxID=3641 RepID=A0A061F5M2_THECC|nr:Uncharacterized protein TCM_025194 [Theobroma cacao]
MSTWCIMMIPGSAFFHGWRWFPNVGTTPNRWIEPLGCSDDYGVGGILRNEHGDVFILFSKSIGVVYVSSPLIESDNQNVVNWITSPNKVPWRPRQLIVQNLNILGKIKKRDIKHTLRSANNEANTLAKEGVLRTVDFLWSLDVGSVQVMEVINPA